MATITATYLDDLGRVRVELLNPTPNVSYHLERSTDGGSTWQPVRGAQNMGTLSVTVIDDFEYTPNVENLYRLFAPAFYDSFQRDYPVGAALQTAQVSSSFASTPDHASLDITGSFDLRVDAQLDSWNSGAQQVLVAKYDFATNNRSYALLVAATGQARLQRSSNGTAVTGSNSTVSIPALPGRRIALRVTYNSATGAVTFYHASNLSGVWTQLGAVVASTPAAVHSGTAPLTVGSWAGGATEWAVGHIFAAQVRNGINGTIVANPVFGNQSPGTTSFNDSTSKTWTVQSGAEIVEIAPVLGFDWGTADTGQEWNLGGSSSGFAMYVESGHAILMSDQPAGTIAEQTTDPITGAVDAEVTWSARYPDPRELLDLSVEWGIGLRSSGNGDDNYESNLLMRPAVNGYEVELRIGKHVSNVFTLLGSVVVGTWQRNVPWFVRFRVQGSQLSARAWQQGSAEPANWTITLTDTDITTNDALFARGYKSGGIAYRQMFGPIEVNTIPQDPESIASVTPVQTEVWLKSIAYPMLNRTLECVDWQELERTSRTAFFDIKGRHEILGIADVGSSATYSLTFISYSKAENRAIVALLTYGGLMLLQPPGDDEDIECPTAYSGIPEGFVMVGDSVQSRTVYGKPMWLWTVQFTEVAPSDADGILPATITWSQLWDLIGPDGTWETVWETWETWQELWLTNGNPLALGG